MATDALAHRRHRHLLRRQPCAARRRRFALQAGRLLGLLGRNGAGKTTCMATIMGFLKPRRGSIALFGEQVAGLAPDTIAAQGHLPGAAGPPHVPLAHGARKPDGGGADGHARRGSRRWSLDRVFALFPRLKERHAQIAGSLSGGEQQMLAIGRALMGNPRVLLMDEPSEGLAPQIVAEVGRTIAQLKAEGQSIVLVEQNIKLTLDLADDVVIINTGAVVFQRRRRARSSLMMRSFRSISGCFNVLMTRHRLWFASWPGLSRPS